MQKEFELKINRKELSNYEILDIDFYQEVSNVIAQSRKSVKSYVNSSLVLANWKIGKMIDEKQNSLSRAEYGEKLVEELAKQMRKDFGSGYSRENLFRMRKFYRTYRKVSTLSTQLSWSHYIYLIGVNDDDARNFYYKEAVKNNWSVRQLAREIHNISYERYILGNKNYAIIQETAVLANKEESVEESRLFIKEPLLLDFLGFKPGYEYYESDLEQAIIDHLEKFLLELGQGYTFVARQKRLDIDGDNFYIDLVLYNIIERCYVIIDLKRGQATHKDIGQMQMYVNYYTENYMLDGDKEPIGMILCADKNDKVIKYTLGPSNRQVRAYKYLTNLSRGNDIKEEAERYLKQLKEKNLIKND